MPIFAFSGSLTHPTPGYRDANGDGITTFAFDDDAGRLEPIAEFAGIDDAGWLTLDAPNRRLYAVCEVPGTDQSAVTAFAIDPASGRLTALNRRPTGGQTGCHASLSTDGKFLLVANYNAAVPAGAPEGAGAAFPVTADGLGPAAAAFSHQGTGPNATRQQRSHAHCAIPSPDGRFLYVADLGIDRIVSYELQPRDGGGLTLRRTSEFAVPPGLGPRHLVFASNGRRLFMVSELIPTVLSLEVDPATGALRQLDAFSIPRLGEPIVQPAGILRTADDRFLFVSLRECDEILGLAIDPQSGRLAQTGRWPSGGRTPRDLELSPSGRHLIVANQDSDHLTVFGVAGGSLTGPVSEVSVGTPMTIRLATF